nr:LysR substrate-binding domain-containing protein [Brevibacterium permense]
MSRVVISAVEPLRFDNVESWLRHGVRYRNRSLRLPNHRLGHTRNRNRGDRCQQQGQGEDHRAHDQRHTQCKHPDDDSRSTGPGVEGEIECRGDADIGIVVAPPDIPAGGDDRFSHHFLIDDPLDLLVPLDHPLADRASVTIADTVDETWIPGRPGTVYHQLVMASCAAAGFAPRIGHFADDLNTGTALVHGGFGVCVASRMSRSQDLHPVRRIPISGDHFPSRHITVVTRTGADARETVAFTLKTLSVETERLMSRLGAELRD